MLGLVRAAAQAMRSYEHHFYMSHTVAHTVHHSYMNDPRIYTRMISIRSQSRWRMQARSTHPRPVNLATSKRAVPCGRMSHSLLGQVIDICAVEAHRLPICALRYIPIGQRPARPACFTDAQYIVAIHCNRRDPNQAMVQSAAVHAVSAL